MNLHKGSIKLASLYLAIIMAISLFFSVNIYQLSTQELGRGLRGPGMGLERQYNAEFTPELRNQLNEEREQLYAEATERVFQRLLLTNLVILLAGGALSYYLALRTLKPIEEAHEAQARFTADASHELRTPITAMLTENEVTLMDTSLTLVKAKEQLTSNIEELHKLTNLSDGLMRLAGLENATLHKESVSVDAVTHSAINRVLPNAEEKQISITKTISTDLVVLGDEQSINELLVILLDNAIKYSPKNTKISVVGKQEQNYAKITVSDKGIGIKATELPHIFDRFYRADTSRTKQLVSGYGLGLAIAKNIVDSHNGQITATSKPDKGTSFTITLPLS